MLLLLQEKSMIKIRLKYCSCLELFTMSVHNLVQKIFLTNLTNVGLKNSKKNLRQRKHIVRTHWNSWSQRAIFFFKWFLQIRLLSVKNMRTGGKTRVVPMVTHNHFADDKTEIHKEVTHFANKPGVLFFNAVLFSYT